MATKFPDEGNATGDNPSEDEKVTEDSCKIVDDMADVPDALAEIRVHDLLAVDCEGVNLGRSGELTVLTIAVPNKTFIFDVLKLGKHVFDDGLRDVLEDKNKEKLMFDCRRDADSLYHQFKVNISGVLDLQLLEVMHRRKSGTSMVKSASGSRRSTRTDDVESIYGFLRCMKLYLSDEEIIKKKKQGHDLLECEKDIWKTRPLTDLLKTYCCIDTTELFSLYNKLKADDDSLPRLRIASSRYADCFRSISDRTNGIYENHAYLPLDIIPDEGSTGFPLASNECVGCHRLFSVDEFSKTQLEKGDQKCRVCKKVKLKADVQNNREADWIRDDCTPKLYYSSDENRWTVPYDDYEDDYGYEDSYYDDYYEDFEYKNNPYDEYDDDIWSENNPYDDYYDDFEYEDNPHDEFDDDIWSKNNPYDDYYDDFEYEDNPYDEYDDDIWSKNNMYDDYYDDFEYEDNPYDDYEDDYEYKDNTYDDYEDDCECKDNPYDDYEDDYECKDNTYDDYKDDCVYKYKDNQSDDHEDDYECKDNPYDEYEDDYEYKDSLYDDYEDDYEFEDILFDGYFDEYEYGDNRSDEYDVYFGNRRTDPYDDYDDNYGYEDSYYDDVW